MNLAADDISLVVDGHVHALVALGGSPAPDTIAILGKCRNVSKTSRDNPVFRLVLGEAVGAFERRTSFSGCHDKHIGLAVVHESRFGHRALVVYGLASGAQGR